ncbi:MAG: HAD-IA family hydrolase [Myxococcales bacterium]
MTRSSSPTSTVSPGRAVVFDLDDTLYAERDFVLSGFRAVSAWAAAELGTDLEETYAELSRLFEQGVRGDTFDRWLGARGFEARAHLPAMVRAYREHLPHLRPAAGATALLERLRRRLRTGLVTDGPADVQRRKLEALGLRRHFDAVVFTGDLGREFWKPHPRGYRQVLALLHVDPPAAAVYVGDNCAKDFLGARRAGLRTLRVRSADGEYRQRDPPTPRHAPELTVDRLEDVEEALATLWATAAKGCGGVGLG